MSSGCGYNQLELRARILNQAVGEVADELRLVDVGDFVAYIRCEQFANIRDIVNSSVERFFKAETLSYAWAADFDLDWNSAPTIILDMEFRHSGVRIVFKLLLRDQQTSVSIEYLSLGRPFGDPHQDTARLIEAPAHARLNPGAH